MMRLAIPHMAAWRRGAATLVEGLYSFGSNAMARTGLNTTTGDTLIPTQVVSDVGWSAVGGKGGFYGHGMGICDGRLYSWGSNEGGGTGLGTFEGNTLIPTQVGSDTDWTVLSATNHSLAIRNGRLYSWGRNAYYQTGRTGSMTNLPLQVEAATDWQTCVAGEFYSLGIRNGKLYAWGSNSNMQLGLGPGTDWRYFTPQQVGSDTDWTAVAAGKDTSMGIRAGRLYYWGRRPYGGPGVSYYDVPTQAGSFTDWSFCSAGTNHCFAIRDGKLYAFGNGSNGQLGLGDTSSKSVPTQVGEEEDWTYCSGGALHSLGIRAGKLYSWGSNGNGRTGLDTTDDDTLLPVQVGLAEGWSVASAGDLFSLAF